MAENDDWLVSQFDVGLWHIRALSSLHNDD